MPRLVSSLPRKEEGAKEAAGGEGSEAREEGRDEE